MGIVVHAQLWWNESAVDQALSVLDVARTCHNGEDMRREEVGRMPPRES
jgi:hypothetical protein